MLEGLEVSEVTFKALTSETDYLRIDSEFHLKEYKTALSLISRNAHAEFGTYLELLTDGKHGGVTLTEEGVVFLRTTNIKENLIDLSDLRFISEEESDETKRAEFNEGDLLITTIGTIGLCAKVPKGFPRGTINQNLVRVVLKDKNRASVFCAFFNSKFGRNQLLRWGAGNVYQMINYPNLRLVLIPSFSDLLSAKTDEIYQAAFLSREQSAAIYRSAETLLLDTLGMADFSPDTGTVNIKSFKDSFVATGRLDAEYYQPKYEDMVEHITAQAHDTLAGLVTIKKSIEPGSDEYSEDEQGLSFLRVADYSKFGITPPQKKLKPAFVAENQEALNALKPKARTILFSKDGSVGEAYCLREDAEFITSGAILHLTVRDTQKILPDYLTLALNSMLVKMQAERDAGGSIILHWRVGEIENVIVPLVDMSIQQKIASLVKESFTLKAESERLLAVAKRAVEMAIEQDETAAMKWIAEQAGMPA